MGALATVREAQGRYAGAVELLHKRYAAAPHRENLLALAKAMAKAGMKEEANAGYKEFEAGARKETGIGDNSNHELVESYLGAGSNSAEAPNVAKLEMSRRQDVHTRALYAQALRAAGNVEEARRQMAEVIAVGTRDPKIVAQARLLNLNY